MTSASEIGVKRMNTVKEKIENFKHRLTNNGRKYSDKTIETYVELSKQILNNDITVTSRSRWLQYKSVIAKLYEYGLIETPDHTKFGLEKSYQQHDTRSSWHILDVQTFERILRDFPKSDAGKEAKLACKIMYYAGTRIGETLAITRDKITFGVDKKNNDEGGIMLLVNKNTKGKTTRKTYYPRNMKSDFDNFERFSIDDVYIRNVLRDVSRRLNIQFHAHDFRHSYACNMINLYKIDVVELQHLLGHKDIKQTLRYFEFVQTRSDKLIQAGY